MAVNSELEKKIEKAESDLVYELLEEFDFEGALAAVKKLKLKKEILNTAELHNRFWVSLYDLFPHPQTKSRIKAAAELAPLIGVSQAEIDIEVGQKLLENNSEHFIGESKWWYIVEMFKPTVATFECGSTKEYLLSIGSYDHESLMTTLKFVKLTPDETKKMADWAVRSFGYSSLSVDEYKKIIARIGASKQYVFDTATTKYLELLADGSWDYAENFEEVYGAEFAERSAFQYWVAENRLIGLIKMLGYTKLGEVKELKKKYLSWPISEDALSLGSENVRLQFEFGNLDKARYIAKLLKIDDTEMKSAALSCLPKTITQNPKGAIAIIKHYDLTEAYKEWIWGRALEAFHECIKEINLKKALLIAKLFDVSDSYLRSDYFLEEVLLPAYAERVNANRFREAADLKRFASFIKEHKEDKSFKGYANFK